ncbi:hypothetical protein Tco_0877861 [Tanacetum coccineum]|uniref:Uncharacterized protein n=1 Tax=Tanacetum coccineum TaxID=301880 RepID=A0ABQ5BW89_9ASTR
MQNPRSKLQSKWQSDDIASKFVTANKLLLGSELFSWYTVTNPKEEFKRLALPESGVTIQDQKNRLIMTPLGDKGHDASADNGRYQSRPNLLCFSENSHALTMCTRVKNYPSCWQEAINFQPRSNFEVPGKFQSYDGKSPPGLTSFDVASEEYSQVLRVDFYLCSRKQMLVLALDDDTTSRKLIDIYDPEGHSHPRSAFLNNETPTPIQIKEDCYTSNTK